MKRLHQLSIGIVFSLFAVCANAQSVDFIEPRDGDTLPTTFTHKFKVEGMPLAPSSDKRQGVGHFHVLIDARDIEPGYVIPNDNQHKHFDKGQTESLMFLQPGKYKLTLQFGDSAHRSYGEKLRKTINITVAGEK
ncbi:MAG: DUF4399 domain-containing protein [Burkholderiaceae bacterium]